MKLIELSHHKGLIDDLNDEAKLSPRVKPIVPFTRYEVRELHVYPSIAFVCK